MTPKIEAFLKDAEKDSPFLVVDLDVVEDRYKRLNSAFSEGHIYYAMKANPAKPILERLNQLGSRFDAASLGEIMQCLETGIDPKRISFGNTLKKQKDSWYSGALSKFRPGGPVRAPGLPKIYLGLKTGQDGTREGSEDRF